MVIFSSYVKLPEGRALAMSGLLGVAIGCIKWKLENGWAWNHLQRAHCFKNKLPNPASNLRKSADQSLTKMVTSLRLFTLFNHLCIFLQCFCQCSRNTMRHHARGCCKTRYMQSATGVCQGLQIWCLGRVDRLSTQKGGSAGLGRRWLWKDAMQLLGCAFLLTHNYT